MREGEEDTVQVGLDPTVTSDNPRPRRSTGDPARWPGDEAGRYENAEFLGEGGMGRVFRAYDARLRRHVAIKLMRGDDPALARRLLREAQAQARIEHPNVCKVFEVGELGGRPYVAMQLIDGRTLGEVARGMSLEERAQVMRDVADAVHAAHRIGVIHRDLKPGNIMVERTEDGRWKPYVVDFGLAREQSAPSTTATDAVIGTPMYMAPEQIRRTEAGVDRRTDVYGLGAAFYEVFADRRLYEGDASIAVMIRVLEEEPDPLRRAVPGLPVDLETIIMTCLAKAPSERYQSARALAEDLDRFLDGEPIAARRASWLYLLRKKARKHRVMVSVIAVALAAVLVAAGWGLYNRWASASRARAAQAFGEEVAGIEAISRQGEMLPQHPIARERARIRARMADIERRMRDLGSIARGPGEYALGRGYLALRDLTGARSHLEAAWRTGFCTPDVAYGLGLALGRAYQQALWEVDRFADDGQRDEQRRVLERELRDPALSYLRRAGGARGGPGEYVEAVMALYERRYTDALSLAQAAVKEAPWMHEAFTLQGDVHVARGDDARARGDYDAAARDYDAAEKAYAAAVDIGRSDTRAYEGPCNLALSRAVLLARGRGSDPKSAYDAGRAACGAALAIDPDDATAHRLMSRLSFVVGEYQADNGGDPREALTAAAASARRAMELEPRDTLAKINLAKADLRLGYLELERGETGEKELAAAQSVMEEALRLQPRDSEPYNIIGIAHLYRAYYAMEHGQDGRPHLERARASLERALQGQPRYVEARLNLGNVLTQLAELTLQDHGDPKEILATAVKRYEEAIAINPKDSLVISDLGYVQVLRARAAMSAGRDPADAFAAAVSNLKKAISIRPTDAYARADLGRALLTRARWERDSGRDSSASARGAIAAFDRSLSLRETDAESAIGLAQSWIFEGVRRANAGVDDVDAAFDAAQKAIDRGLAVNGDYAEAYVAAARLQQRRAESKNGAARRAAATRGLRELERARAINPEAGSAELEKSLRALVSAAPARSSDPSAARP